MSDIQVVPMENEKLKKDLINFMNSNRLIPVIGSGFSRSSKATNGIVPSGQDMKIYMIAKLKEKFPNEKFSEDFSKIAQQYENHCDINDRKKYLSNNFTNVQLEWYKRDFLKINWPYMYTLNIDDAIESNSDFKVVLPLSEINQEYEAILNNRSIYKIHGDVKHYLLYKESKMYIFSQTQYLNSLKQNNFLLNKISTDIRSNSVMFIGCSLSDEIDLLYSLNIHGYTPSSMKTTYYVTDREISLLQQKDLEMYGIDTIIKIESYEDFYMYLNDINEMAKRIPTSDIDNFLNPRMIYEQEGYNENIEYIYKSNKIYNDFEKKKSIKLPNFIIQRELFNKQEDFRINFIDKNLIVIYGHRFSGKTYFLINLMRKLQNENFFFIPSLYKINQETLNSLINVENATLFFDTGSIDEMQIEFIYNKFEKVIKNNCRIVFSLDSSEKENLNALNKFRTSKEIEKTISINYLDNKFLNKEVLEINKKLDSNAIGRFRENKEIKQKTKQKIKNNSLTVLDNIFEIVRSAPKNDLKMSYFKNIHEMEIDNDRMIALIILATKNRLSAHDMSLYKLNESIGKFIEMLEPISQFEYTNSFEKNSSDHSGTKVIINSKYWVLHELGEFSLLKRNIPLISRAYKNIVESILNNYSSDYKGRRQAAKKISEFIKFDVINDIFPKESKGSLLVIKDIYVNLEQLLKDDYQYFHQRAKSLAWTNNEEDLQNALIYATKSKHDMEIEIREYKIKFSYMHVCYTIASILAKLAQIHNYKDKTYIEKATNAIHEALEFDENLNYLKPSDGQHIPRGSQAIVELIKHISINGKEYGLNSDITNELFSKTRQLNRYIK
ncbi:SIR2 family protein [Paenibacillus kyungheensis]|uniref:SIR2 family protein n=1 Tax=Paenibacillus kyungheensis TaxID=1452732 RepID=A0AAX3M3F5_9BACL|nr:SIR2 family protein [Paenibacillus kyungheensis]WCT56114.1 SIR2 family protein [Paenibacillus kyungheensis]